MNAERMGMEQRIRCEEKLEVKLETASYHQSIMDIQGYIDKYGRTEFIEDYAFRFRESHQDE